MSLLENQKVIDISQDDANRSDIHPPANETKIQDPLASALTLVCRHYGKYVSEEALIAGLPMENGCLSASLFVRAAARFGITAIARKLPIEELLTVELPVVMVLNDKSALMVQSIDATRNTLLITNPWRREFDRHVSLAELRKDYSGFLFTFEVKSDVSRTTLDKNSLQNDHWFWSTIRSFWKSYMHVVLAAFLLNLLTLSIPLFTMNVYDRVVPNFAFPTLWAMSIGVCLALVFDLLLKTARSQMLNHIGAKADVLLGSRLFEHVMRLDMACRPASAGSFANQLREFETVRDFFTSSSLVSIIDMLFIGISLLVLFMLVGPIVWVPIIAVPTVILIGLFVQSPLSRSISTAQNEAAARHSVLVESISNLETIRALRAEGHMQQLWERSVSSAAKAQKTGRFWSQLAMALSGMVQSSVIIFIIIFGVYLVSIGEITVGAMIAASMLSSRMLSPLGNIVSTLTRLRQTISSFSNIDRIMTMKEERADDRTVISKTVSVGTIEARNVTFRYPESVQDSIINLNLNVRGGECIGVIGKVGSGKTTFGRLISGLYYPSAGSLLVDGVDTRQYDPSSLRKGVGFVGQDSSLFLGTVRENIAIANPMLTDEELIEAAQISGTDDFIRRHPQGYDMPVGENGRLLSGGQRQSVALARTLVLRPQILFLDEPSSNLDMTAEALLVKRLRKISQSGSTIFISTHRTSLLGLVDRLLVFDDGKLALDGPKEKVLEKLRTMQASNMKV